MENNEYINLIKPYFKDCNAYIVGGFVRDYFLGKTSCDCDVVLDKKDLKKFIEKLASEINATFVPLHDDFEIYRIVMEDKIHYFDFAKIEGKDILEDLSRRDYTINAIGYDINKNELIDPYNGINDIKTRIIKVIKEKNIVDDPLRIMRAFRFSAMLGFQIDDETFNIIKKHHSLINIPAKERLVYELMKMFSGENVKEVLLKMDECDLINDIFPYFEEIKKIPPNTHHHLSLFNHLLESVRQIEIEFEKQTDEVKTYLKEDFGVSTRLAYLKLSAFLHDYGKPSTWTIEPNTKRHRFIGHDLKGAEMIKPVLRDLKFSNKQVSYISNMLKYHIYPSQLASNPDVTDKAKLRFYNKMKDEVIDVILLANADRNSALGKAITKEMINQNRKGLKELLDGYFKERNRLKDMPPLLNGYEIMQILNIGESKELGDIVKELCQAQIEKTVNNKNQAIEFIKNFKK